MLVISSDYLAKHQYGKPIYSLLDMLLESARVILRVY